MSDFVDLLLKEQANPNAAILEFFSTDLRQNDVAVFVEGRDDPRFYYDFLVDKYPSKEIVFFCCSNKRGVLDTYKFLSQYSDNYSVHAMDFLCDSDFDPIWDLTHHGISATKFYSIESYFADANLVDYLIKKFASPNVRVQSRRRLIAEIDRIMLWMSSKALSTMSYACILRKNHVDFDFDLISVEKLFKIDENSKRIYAVGARSKVFDKAINGNRVPIKFSEFRFVSNKMKSIHFKYWLRGKLALQMLKMAFRYCSDRIGGIPKSVVNQVGSMIGIGLLAQGKAYLINIDI